MDLRIRLRRIIQFRGISIRELARLSGVRRASIQQFLHGGNLHIGNIEKVLSALGCAIVVQSRPSPTLLDQRLRKHVRLNREEIAQFCRHHGVTMLAIYGSLLGNAFREASDIDLVVDLQESVTMFELIDMERELQRVLQTAHQIHLVTVNGLSPVIADEVLNTAEVIYAKAA